MLKSLREETEGKLQMLLSPRQHGLIEEVRVFKGTSRTPQENVGTIPIPRQSRGQPRENLACVCDWNRQKQESRALLTPKPPKSLKKVSPGLLARSAKKCQKDLRGPKKESKRTKKRVFGDFFDTFSTLRAGRPGNTF